MSDGYEDGFQKDVKPQNIKKIPKKKAAVALSGAEGGQKVPHISAAGYGEMAQRILDLAYENGINVREDSDLAELLTTIEIDSPIPSEAFMAVGEILSYVYRANGQADPFDTVLEDE